MENKSLKIKICGMRDAENIKAVDALHPDYLGFIFYSISPRYIAPGSCLPDTKAQKVGVFVNASMEEIIKTTREHGIATIQLHGNENTWFCCDLTDLGYKVIKAFRIDENVDIEYISEYQGCCEFFLYDTKAKAVGGTGKKFDWNILTELDPLGPFFLSGGIGPDDVATIKSLNLKNLIGLDLNSRFELEPALKDVDKLYGFMQNFTSNTIQFNI
jgi:phosphoribosylanthranilate isomerase